MVLTRSWEYNRSADHVLLSDPGAFFDALMQLEPLDSKWFDMNRMKRGEWVEQTLSDLQRETSGGGGCR